MSLSGLNIQQTQPKTHNFYLPGDEIPFVIKFYPLPYFVKFTFPQTEPIRNQSASFQKSINDTPQQDKKIGVQSQFFMPSVQYHEDDVLEIGSLIKGPLFAPSKIRQKDFASNNQSQQDYRQLLEDLNLEQQKKKLLFQSENLKNSNYYFQLPECEKSLNSEEQSPLQSNQLKKADQLEKGRTKEPSKMVVVSKNYSWNPPQEIQFVKKNQICRAFWIISKRTKKIYGEFMQIINTCKAKRKNPSMHKIKKIK